METLNKIQSIKEALKSNFGVKYNPITHTYTNAQGVVLAGITGMIKQFICPNQYDNVAPEILENARLRGNKLHSLLEVYASGVFPDISEEDKEIIDSFYAMVVALGDYTCIASEYVVSNNVNNASPIDILALDKDGKLTIIDLKTTSALNVDLVTWQLNFYRYFLFLQTGLEAERLLTLHVTGSRAKFVEIPFIEFKHLDYMLNCAYKFESFNNPLKADKKAIDRLEEVYRRKKDLEAQIKALEAEEEEAKALVIAEMKKNAVKTHESLTIRVTYKSAGTSTRFDAKALEAENEEVYKKYLKTSTTKEGLTIKLK